MRFAIALLGSLLVTGTASAQAFQNGSFENGSFSPTPDNYNILYGGSTAIAGWIVIAAGPGNNVAWLKNGNIVGATSSNLQYSLDLTGGGGGSNDSDLNSMRQTFDTIVGHTYMLSVDVGTNKYTSSGGAIVQALINGNSLYTFKNTSVSSSQNWLTGSTTFVASGISTTLDLAERYDGSINNIDNSYHNYYTGLDNVKVVDVTPTVPGAVPEPASWAMMIGGFGMVGGALRRRRVVARTAIA